jgi:chromate transporter
VTNLLPGPMSSQLGMAIGAHRAGIPGSIAAWLGFTLPSAVLMTAFALVIGSTDVAGAGWVHGLELVAVPVVLLAVLAMRRTLAPDRARLAVAVAGLALALGVGGFAGQLAALAVGAVVGLVAFGALARAPELNVRVGRRGWLAIACLVTLAGLLLGLPAIRDATGSQAVALVDAMVRSGAFVFGGGHVVLPLLDQALVEPGWVPEQEFLAGYGLAQAMPGPLFSFSAYLGALEEPAPNGVAGASLALVAIYVPSFLLLGGVLPFWSSLRRHVRVQAALVGVSAAVVGVLAAAFWDPILTGSIDAVGDVAFAAGLFVLLRLLPVWAVVPLAAAAGAVVF